MSARSCIARAMGTWMILAAAVTAQETRITIGAAGTDRLKEDLKVLVELAPNPKLKQQWETLEAVLDSFAQGVDTAKPLRVDVMFGSKELGYFAAIPVAKLAGRGGFIENVESFGYSVSPADPAGIQTIEQVRARPRPGRPAPSGPPQKPFYMKVAFNQAIFASDKKLLSGNLPDPSLAMPALIPGDTDVVADMLNDAETMVAKRTVFQDFRKQLESALEFKRGESQEQFELRKLSLEQHLTEAERFLIESQRLNMRWTTDQEAKQGLGELLLSALPGTDLLASIQLLVQQPSYFSNVTFAPKPALQLRVNFAIDPLRSRHASELYPKLLPVMQAAMDDRPNLNAEGKAAAKEALSKLFGMLTEAIPLKVLDAFVDVHATDDGKHAMVCGIRAADGTKATEILQLFPKIREGWKIQAGVAEHRGVTVHAVAIAPHRMDEFQAVFGGEPVVYVGVTKDAVWAAAGLGAMDKLKGAIDQAAQPAPEMPSPEFLALEMRFEPWVKVLEILRSKEPPSTTTDKTEQEIEKQRTKLRKYALETMAPGDDLLKGSLRREGEEVHGRMEVKEGLLRFIGTVIGDFTAENLQ